MKRRNKIRLIAFLTAVIFSLSVWGIASQESLKTYRILEQNIRLQALAGLCENFSEIDVSLKKCLYADDSALTGVLADKLTAACAGAKVNLSNISSQDQSLYNICKYLSQVGAYAKSLGTSMENGTAISDTDNENLERLSEYASSLYSRFAYLNELMSAGSLSFDKLEGELQASADTDTVSFLSAADEAEQSMKDYPTLIYDGPFSDNIQNKTSVLLENCPEISADTAREKAAGVLEVEPKYLSDAGQTRGKTAGYLFSYDNRTVCVSKRGGKIVYVLSQSFAGTQRLTVNDAVECACTFLNKCDYQQMQATYDSVYNGVCTVNFAYCENGYICYPDLIKVSVDLSNGKITAMDASDYLMNHVSRVFPKEQITPEQATSAVSGSLTVNKVYRAVIPTQGGGEKFTFEVMCENKNGDDILVYIDTVSAKTDDILLLISDENGTLTK